MLKNSARNCTRKASEMRETGTFLYADMSRSSRPGPTTPFRPELPSSVAGDGNVKHCLLMYCCALPGLTGCLHCGVLRMLGYPIGSSLFKPSGSPEIIAVNGVPEVEFRIVPSSQLLSTALATAFSRGAGTFHRELNVNAWKMLKSQSPFRCALSKNKGLVIPFRNWSPRDAAEPVSRHLLQVYEPWTWKLWLRGLRTIACSP